MSIFFFILNYFWLNYYRYNNPYNQDPDDLEIPNRIKTSAWFMTKIFLWIVAILIPMTLTYGGRINLLYKVYEYQPSKLNFSGISSVGGVQDNFIAKEYSVKLFPQFIVFLMGPFLFCGSWIFNILVAFGMATVPVYFFTIWIKRPRKPNPEDMVMSDIILQEMSSEAIEKLKELIETKEEIEEVQQEPNHDTKAINIKIDTLQDEIVEIQKQLVLFEEVYEIKKKNHNILEENPLKYLFALVMGFVSTFISFTIIFEFILSMFYRFSFWERIFYKIMRNNMVFLVLCLFLLFMYMLFALFRGYESLGYYFPNILGYNQMNSQRTWFDTWCIMANFIIAGVWGIITFFIRLSPSLFAVTRYKRLLLTFGMNLEYIFFFKEFSVYRICCLFFFMLGLLFNGSKVFMKDKLTQKLEDTKKNLNNNQKKFQKDARKNLL
jgi:hypothetical protein